MNVHHAKWLGRGVLAVGVLAASHGIGVADDALNKAIQNDDNWAMYGRTYDNQRYSPLKQINDQNVGKLKLAYAFQVGALRSNEATPIEIDGTLYIPSSSGPKNVYALDAQTGVMKWQYQPDVAQDVIPYVCCDLDARGVAYADGKILFGQLDGHLVAVDAKTGKELWKINVGSGVGAGPMTFAVDGKQYVAVLAGRAEGPPAYMGEVGKKIIAATPEGGTLFVFSL